MSKEELTKEDTIVLENFLSKNKNPYDKIIPTDIKENFISIRQEIRNNFKPIDKKEISKAYYGIISEGKVYQLYYEELVEILAAINTCELGSECFVTAKIKANLILRDMPVTDY